MTKKDRLMVLGLLAVVLLGGFFMLVLSPQRKAAADAEAAVATAQTELMAAQQKVTAGKAAQEQFQRDRTTIVKLGRVVPETDDIPTLLTQLQAIAERYDVKFTSYSINAAGGGGAAPSSGAATATTPEGAKSTDSVAPLYTPGSVEVAGGLARTPITIELVGKYFNLEQYLRAVQRFAVFSAKREKSDGRLVMVDGFGYAIHTGTEDESSKKSKSKSPDLKATLAASVYYAPPLQTPSASAPADPAASATAPTPASSSTPSTSTGAAAVGGLR